MNPAPEEVQSGSDNRGGSGPLIGPGGPGGPSAPGDPGGDTCGTVPERPRRTRRLAPMLLLSGTMLAVFMALAAGSGPDSALSAWDQRVYDALVAWRSSGRSELFWAVTLIGNTPVLASLSFSAVVLLALWGRRAAAFLVGGGLLVAWGISEAAKSAVGRLRPPAAEALIALPGSSSMPSGHAITTLVFLALLTYIAFGWLVRRAGIGRGAMWGILVLVVIVTGLIGVSRIYLGVHWASDVLGGWVLGGAWLAVLLGVLWPYLNRVFLSSPPPPRRPVRARAVIRASVAVVLTILCVAAYVLTALSDPLLTHL